MNLRKSKVLDGIPVRDIMYLLSQYADDMDTFLKMDKKNFCEFFKILEWFKLQSGFTVNYDKMTVYRVGSARKSKAVCYTEKDLVWTNEPVNIQGIWVAPDDEIALTKNYDGVIEKSRSILSTWKKMNTYVNQETHFGLTF